MAPPLLGKKYSYAGLQHDVGLREKGNRRAKNVRLKFTGLKGSLATTFGS
jgi:hypothetical protein